jgi:hypothetical protein
MLKNWVKMFFVGHAMKRKWDKYAFQNRANRENGLDDNRNFSGRHAH